MTTDASNKQADRRSRWPHQDANLLLLGAVATAACLAAEIWLVLELLAVLPEGTADPADIEWLADIGKVIAGATGATLVVRGFLDRLGRRGRLSGMTIVALAFGWLAITAGIHRSLVIITDAIVDSLPAEARQDAMAIALYRKNVQDGAIIDPDYGPGGTVNDLQRVKAINAAIGLLDRERDYVKRFEGAIRSGAEARKTEVVRRAEREAATLRARLDVVRQPFIDLADGRPHPAAVAAWTAYDALWKAAPETRVALLNGLDGDLFPAWPDPPIRPLSLGDIPPGYASDGFARFVADALTSRRDAALWAIEDRALSALETINRETRFALGPTEERQLVLSVVVPPLALSFGAVGVIANATALALLVPGLAAAVLARRRWRSIMRIMRPASVLVPWVVVATAMAIAPPLPFTDDQGFARIARQTREAPDVALWTDLWLRMIGVEARLLGTLPGRS